uniref:RxLR effector protein n=1 Tax=Globisporangium ultimum (strain ATCC 200006 / CBS 805.95 / DAOM BR144) TaxID=431595 RepID=K3WY08_GLOUD
MKISSALLSLALIVSISSFAAAQRDTDTASFDDIIDPPSLTGSFDGSNGLVGSLDGSSSYSGSYGSGSFDDSLGGSGSYDDPCARIFGRGSHSGSHLRAPRGHRRHFGPNVGDFDEHDRYSYSSSGSFDSSSSGSFDSSSSGSFDSSSSGSYDSHLECHDYRDWSSSSSGSYDDNSSDEGSLAHHSRRFRGSGSA